MQKGKHVPDLIVNVRLMADPELIRLVIYVEDVDESGFECKVGYWIKDAIPFGEWWDARAKDISEWLTDWGLDGLRERVLACAMRMHVPMREMLKGVVPSSKVTPMTFTVQEPLGNSEVLRVQTPPPPPKKAKKKASEENQDELLL